MLYYTKQDADTNYTTRISLQKSAALSLYIDLISIKFPAYSFRVQSSHHPQTEDKTAVCMN